MSVDRDGSSDLVLPARGRTTLKPPVVRDSGGAESSSYQVLAPFAERPPWRQGVYGAVRYFLWVAGVSVVWSVVARSGIIGEIFADGVTLTLSALLFIFSCPFALFFKLDSLLEGWAANLEPEEAFLLILPFLLANFVIIGAFLGFRRGMKAKSRSRSPR